MDPLSPATRNLDHSPVMATRPQPSAGSESVLPSASAKESSRSQYWRAFYSGDPNTSTHPSSTLCGDEGETSVVNPIQSGISTHQSVIPNDTATITGGGGGTVRFRLCSGATCDGTALVDQTKTVASAVAPPTPPARWSCSTEHFAVTFTNG